MEHTTQIDGRCSCGYTHPPGNTTVAIFPDGDGILLVEYQTGTEDWEASGEPLF